MYFFIFFTLLFLNTISESFIFKKLFFKNKNYSNNKKNIEEIYIDYLKTYEKYDLLDNNQFNGLFKFHNYDQTNFDIFKKNYEMIEETNNQLKNNNLNFELGFNSDFDTIPFDVPTNNLMEVIIPKNYTFKTNYQKYMKSPLMYFKNIFSIRKEFNWNHTDYLSPVKNQGKCGSCWAFASTNALESFMRSQNYNITRLSEQELVDCSKENYGCNGGFMHKAFDFIIKNKGLVSNEDYPYKAITQKCNFCKCSCHSNNSCELCDSCNLDFSNTTIIHKNKVNGSYLKEYEFSVPKSIIDRIISLQISPITIAVDASSIYFRYYKSGIIDININGTQQLNHAVLLVGYGFDNDGLYWIIQNSWGSDWGDNGFCKIRVKDGEGILLSNMYGVYPTKI